MGEKAERAGRRAAVDRVGVGRSRGCRVGLVGQPSDRGSTVRGQHARVRPATRARSFLFGGEGISAHGTTGVVPRDIEKPGAQKLRRRATSSPTIDHVPGPPARRPDRLFTLRWNSGEAGRLGGRREGRRGPSLRPHSRVGSKRGQPAVLPLFRVKAKVRARVQRMVGRRSGFRHEVTGYDETGTRQHGASGATTNLGAKRARAAVLRSSRQVQTLVQAPEHRDWVEGGRKQK